MSIRCAIFGHDYSVQSITGPRRWCLRCGTRAPEGDLIAAKEASYAQRKLPVSVVGEDGRRMGFREYFIARTGWNYPTLEGPGRAPDGGAWEPDVIVILADYLDALASVPQ